MCEVMNTTYDSFQLVHVSWLWTQTAIPKCRRHTSMTPHFMLMQVMRWLLAANFHPSTADLGRMRQCLHTFFPAFTGFSAGNRLLLARAAMPAARLAICSAEKPKQSAAPLILQFAFELLQVCTHLHESNEKDDSWLRQA